MSSISVAGDTSGSITLSAPAVSGSSVLTLPVATDTLVGKATTDTLTNKSIAATQLTGTIAVAALPAGSVVQVASTVKTDTFTSSANATWTDITGISVSITPISASNKILIFSTVQGSIFRPAANAVLLRLLRNSTAIGIGDAASTRGRTTFGASVVSNDSIVSTTINYLDSPATTSSTTYKIQFYQDTPANPLQINRTVTDTDSATFGRCISTITVMEVAG